MKTIFSLLFMGLVLVSANKSQAETSCDLSRQAGNYSESRGGRCLIHRPHGAPEFSAATYRLFALDAFKKGKFDRECFYLQQAVNAVEPGLPYQKSGSLSQDCRWDYNAEVAATYASPVFNGIWCPGKGPGFQTCKPY